MLKTKRGLRSLAPRDERVIVKERCIHKLRHRYTAQSHGGAEAIGRWLHCLRIRFSFFHITLYYLNECSEFFQVSLILSFEPDYFISMHANFGVTEFICLGSRL